MNQNNNKCLILLIALTMTIFGVGCGGEEEVKKPVVTQKPTAPKKPKAKTVEELVTKLGIDDRVFLSESEAPRLETERIALLKFFDAMVQVDLDTIKSMLSYGDQVELDTMVDEDLASYMSEVSLIELLTGDSPEGRSCVMAIYEIGMDYQVQMWFYDGMGSDITFSAAETAPNLIEKLSGNLVQSYFELKSKLAEIALQPDEETSYTLAGELTSSDGTVGTDESKPGPPSQPGGPIGR